MAIDPFQVATDGVGPGFTPFSMAMNGFGFDIQITVQPITGGGAGRPNLPYIDDYKITVVVKYKGKTYKQSKIVTADGLKTLEKVIAFFKRIKESKPIQILASFKKINK